MVAAQYQHLRTSEEAGGLIESSDLSNMSFRKFLITQFFEGRQDVIIWALSGFLNNLEVVKIINLRTIATQAGRDVDHMQRREQSGVGLADADAVSRIQQPVESYLACCGRPVEFQGRTGN